MKIYVNGRQRSANDGISLGVLLEELSISKQETGVAVAVNDAVIPKPSWETTVLPAEARIEIVHAVAGG